MRALRSTNGMLQAFIDDSRTGEDVLVLAGYVALWNHWEQLTVKWRSLLDERPKWDEFKMARAANRPERVRRFHSIIEEHTAVYIACVVEIAALRKLCRELALPPFVANPYNFAIKAILGATYMELGEVGLRWPITFIFDERGEKKHLRDAWGSFVVGMPDHAKELIQQQPIFANSKTVVPLQSAEIIAWHVREHWLKYRCFDTDIELIWGEPNPTKGLLKHWDYNALKPNMQSLRGLLLSWGHKLAPTTDEELSV